nr:LPXTG cell wall anchor domain-containing protein [Vagococcus allomyrinae]
MPQTGEAVQQYSALGAGFIVSAGLVFYLGKTRRKS